VKKYSLVFCKKTFIVKYSIIEIYVLYFMFWFILNTICLYVSNPRNDFTKNHKRGGAFHFGCAVVPYLPLKLDMFYTPPATRVHCLTPEPHLVSLS
jgi:hypothetical protein